MTETYEFTLLVAGADVQTDEALNALAEAGCDDATVGSQGGVQHLDFDREASSYLAAVLSAVEDVETAVPGVRVVRVLPDEYVTLAEIAQRTGRTRESARLLSIGERGPGGFPPPAARGAERNKLWRWAEVAAWFASALGEPVHLAPPSAQRAANALLDLRASTAELGREELSRVRQELGGLIRRVRLIEMASPASLDAKDARWSHADST
ncbi:MAG: helix-turn-helix transcriptional regulator [Streptosporangiaceae bacterium]